MIHHVNIPVGCSQADACAAFYELIGFTVIDVPDSIGDRAVWLQDGDSQLHLEFTDEPQPISGHIAFTVPDFEQVVSAVRAAGHDFEPRAEHWGAPRGFTHDPAGHKIELMAFAP